MITGIWLCCDDQIQNRLVLLLDRATPVHWNLTCSPVQVWELSSGELLLSVLFDVEIMSVTCDPCEYFLFCGGSDGNIFQVSLCSQVSLILRPLSLHAEDYIHVNFTSVQIFSMKWSKRFKLGMRLKILSTKNPVFSVSNMFLLHFCHDWGH